jgi:hypothetical protein
MEGPVPDYPQRVDPDAVLLRLRMDGLLVGRMREIVCRSGSSRRDRFAVWENGERCAREVGLVTLFDAIRSGIHRLEDS